jgi:hypothetical protein
LVVEEWEQQAWFGKKNTRADFIGKRSIRQDATQQTHFQLKIAIASKTTDTTATDKACELQDTRT